MMRKPPKQCGDCGKPPYQYEGCARVVCPQRRHYTAMLKVGTDTNERADEAYNLPPEKPLDFKDK